MIFFRFSSKKCIIFEDLFSKEKIRPFMSKKIENKLQKFIDSHQDLITTYEYSESAIPLEYCRDEICNIYQSAQRSNKGLDFDTFLATGIKNAVKYNANLIDSLGSCVAMLSSRPESDITQRYFKEINDIYVKNNNNYDIEYCTENRDKLIEMNLKTVISIAKKYRGLGLSLNELISAGNLGLVTAFDKFDPTRSTLKDNVLAKVDVMPDRVSFEELYENIKEFFEYGNIKKKFNEEFHAGHIYSKADVIRWVNSNIYNAKFNSVAVMWIRAYILIEIDDNSRIVKKPKAEIYKDRLTHGSYKKEVTLDIDAPISGDTNTSISELFTTEEEEYTDFEVAEAYDTYKQGLNLLLDGVKKRDRNIFLKKFGIGLPRPMLPKEIADQEGLSIARVSQIFRTVIEQMQRNQIKYDIDPDVLFDAVRKIQ